MERCVERAEAVCKNYPRLCYKCLSFREESNADRIRAMTDEELARVLIQSTLLDEKIGFCQNLPECDALLETEEGIPEEKCQRCLLKWLQQPVEDKPK